MMNFHKLTAMPLNSNNDSIESALAQLKSVLLSDQVTKKFQNVKEVTFLKFGEAVTKTAQILTGSGILLPADDSNKQDCIDWIEATIISKNLVNILTKYSELSGKKNGSALEQIQSFVFELLQQTESENQTSHLGSSPTSVLNLYSFNEPNEPAEPAETALNTIKEKLKEFKSKDHPISWLITIISSFYLVHLKNKEPSQLRIESPIPYLKTAHKHMVGIRSSEAELRRRSVKPVKQVEHFENRPSLSSPLKIS